MKVSHTIPNSVNPIRLSRNELDVSNHLIRIITLTRGIVLMNPLPWVCLMLFIHEQTDRDISEPFGWYWWWDSNPHWTVPKTVASCRWATPAYNKSEKLYSSLYHTYIVTKSNTSCVHIILTQRGFIV